MAGHHLVVVKAPVRRLHACALDYLVIAFYIGILPAASSAILATQLRRPSEAMWSNAWSAELAGFLLLTSISPSLSLHLQGLRPGTGTPPESTQVRWTPLGTGRAFLRSVVKFAPWELAHFTIWHYVRGTCQPAGAKKGPQCCTWSKYSTEP